MPKLFFMHNAKAGGTSLRAMLEVRFPADERAPVFANAPVDARQAEQNLDPLKGYSFYSAHFGHKFLKALGDGHEVVTNFRDPVSRILSLYNYWRNSVPVEHLALLPAADAASVHEAKSKTFSQFIRSDLPSVQLYIRDSHFRQLYWSNWEMQLGSFLSLRVVERRIAAARWFYVTELPELSLLFLHKAFPDTAFPPLPELNVTQRSEAAVSRADAEYLVALNRRDLAIYGYAVSRLMRTVG
jgi:hypothetical protein